MPGNPPTPMGSASSMQEAGVSYKTSWVRYAHGRITLDGSVEFSTTVPRLGNSPANGSAILGSVTFVGISG